MEKLQALIEEGLLFFGIGRDATTTDRLVRYVEDLGRWNRTMNLVGLKESQRIVIDLLYDAFFLHTRVAGLNCLLDLGSGAGIVSIPLAILNPGTQIVSLDSNLKKIPLPESGEAAFGSCTAGDRPRTRRRDTAPRR